MISSFTTMKNLFRLLVFVWMIPAYGQSQHNDFFQTHVRPLNYSMGKGGMSFSMLDSVVDDYSFFFTAEEHWLSVNTHLQFEFLVYLHRQANVRNLILEGGYSYGFLINKYLETGNDNYLFKAIFNPPVCPTNLVEMFRKLYEYNQSLPKRERIRVTGIDLEQSPRLVLETLNIMLPNKPLTSGVRAKMEQLQKLYEAEYDDKEVRKYFRQLHKEVQLRRRAYRRLWGHDFWLFEMILDNTIQGFDSPLLREFVYAHGDQRKREATMYQNFRKLYKEGKMNKGSFFAQFGAIHTELNPSINWGYPTLAHSLNFNKLSPVQGQVLTISKYFRRFDRIYERFNEFRVFKALMTQIEKTYPNDIVLCRLLDYQDLFPEISKDFQYILIIDEAIEQLKCE